jgi:hypothetical protein
MLLVYIVTGKLFSSIHYTVLYRLMEANMANPEGQRMEDSFDIRYLWDDDDADNIGVDRTTAHHSQVTYNHTNVSPNVATDLGESYKQCRAAKEASLKMKVTAATTAGNGDTTYASMLAPSARIGSFETQGSRDIYKTFRGNRVNAGGGKMSPFLPPSIRQHCYAFAAKKNIRSSVPEKVLWCVSVTKISSQFYRLTMGTVSQL